MDTAPDDRPRTSAWDAGARPRGVAVDLRARPPVVVPAAGRIRREALDPDAVFVVRHLQRSGHESYLVGGCVRDLLLGMEPKDFDVATDAPPTRIKRLFRSAFIIGRRFRLVHVRFPMNRIVETATFRGDPGEQTLRPDRPDGPIHDDNVFGTAVEDAWRRDFTVNGLFYDPVADLVVDHVGGLADLETRTIRALGDPDVRLREDPVRMIRAVHFAARLGGSLEPSLSDAITRCAGEIAKASRSRLYVELVKVLGRGCARPTLRTLHERRVLDDWLPELVGFLDRPIPWPAAAGGTHEAAREGEPDDTPPSHRTWNLLGAADAWGLGARGAPESLMLAALLGPWLLDSYAHGPRRGPDVWAHVEETFRPIALRMNVPRKTSWELREILGMQARLAVAPEQARRVRSLVLRPVFPEALAYFELDLRARDKDLTPVEDWHGLADEVWGDADARRSRPAASEIDDSVGDGALRRSDTFSPGPEGTPDSEGSPDPVSVGDGGPPRRRGRRGGRGRGRRRDDARGDVVPDDRTTAQRGGDPGDDVPFVERPPPSPRPSRPVAPPPAPDAAPLSTPPPPLRRAIETESDFTFGAGLE